MGDFVDFSGINPDDIPEGEVHPDGTECEIRITNITQGTDKNGVPYIMPWYEDPGNVNVKDFSDYLPRPTNDATEKENGNRIRKLASFAKCFSLDLFVPEFNLDEAKGATGFVLLGLGKDRDGGDINKVKKYLANA
jgi:hypothetical protein